MSYISSTRTFLCKRQVSPAIFYWIRRFIRWVKAKAVKTTRTSPVDSINIQFYPGRGDCKKAEFRLPLQAKSLFSRFGAKYYSSQCATSLFVATLLFVFPWHSFTSETKMHSQFVLTHPLYVHQIWRYNTLSCATTNQYRL